MEPPSSQGHIHQMDMACGNDQPRPDSLLGEETLSDGFAATPEILVRDRRWRCHVREPEKLVWRALAACADAGGLPGTVVLATDREVRELNGRHRGRYKPTNVLTFDPPPGYEGGDIILALETVLREARRAGRPVADHLAHLVVHGSLHLAGYDHHHPGDAREMEMREARILSRLSVPNPWKPRS
ncbi:rRNA maturation RNase YbeY [Acetobacter papayae]|uniref:rRNA maturation RNase YbeY n=1 Tax=Acetobacter papayae TaxID=1076592 RepID=UPI00046EFA54